MPGIIAVCTSSPEQYQQGADAIRRMGKACMHEPFYKSDFVSFPRLNLHIGRIWLDNCADTAAGFWNEDKTLFCACSGELFSLGSLTKNLHSAGIDLGKKKNCSELVLRAYAHYGEKAIGLLNGWFHLVIVDLRKNSIIIANDRLGMHPLYYGQLTSDIMIVAPEIKCFLHAPGCSPSIDTTALVHYLRYSVPLEQRTFFANVKRMPIASLFSLQSGNTWHHREYWSPESIYDQPLLSPAVFIEKATQKFEEIVPDYYEEGTTGLSLTGGWDTRAIMSILNRKKLQVPCYTFSGMYRGSYDVQIASLISRFSGNTHHRLVLGDEFLKNFDTWVTKAITVSDGLSRIVRADEYYMNLRCREYGKIRLTGKYGSQLVRHITLLKDRSPSLRILSPDFKAFFTAVPSAIRPWSKAEAIRFEFPQLECCTQSQEMAALSVRTPYTDNEFVNLLLQVPPLTDTTILQKNIVLRNSPEWSMIPTNCGDAVLLSFRTKMLQQWYKTTNFFDTAYNWERLSRNQFIICQAWKCFGFAHLINGRNVWRHYRLWFSSELKNYVQQIMLDPKTLARPYWNKKFIEMMVYEHCSRRNNFACEIDLILGLELWLRSIEKSKIC